MATRRTQPYRKGSEQRSSGPALSAMVRGAPASLPNPQDIEREAIKRWRKRKTKGGLATQATSARLARFGAG